MMLPTAMQQMESTRTEANRKVRYLTVSVNPTRSNHFMSGPAFLFLAGISPDIKNCKGTASSEPKLR